MDRSVSIAIGPSPVFRSRSSFFARVFARSGHGRSRATLARFQPAARLCRSIRIAKFYRITQLVAGGQRLLILVPDWPKMLRLRRLERMESYVRSRSSKGTVLCHFCRGDRAGGVRLSADAGKDGVALLRFRHAQWLDDEGAILRRLRHHVSAGAPR